MPLGSTLVAPACPRLIAPTLQGLAKNEFVLGTRYGEGFAVDKDWPWYRVIISKGGRLLARPLTPLRFFPFPCPSLLFALSVFSFFLLPPPSLLGSLV